MQHSDLPDPSKLKYSSHEQLIEMVLNLSKRIVKLEHAILTTVDLASPEIEGFNTYDIVRYLSRQIPDQPDERLTASYLCHRWPLMGRKILHGDRLVTRILHYEGSRYELYLSAPEGDDSIVVNANKKLIARWKDNN